MRINPKTATIEELEDKCFSVMGTNYGHNMIGIICDIVKERFGKKESERFFNMFQM